jgi:hypothetical protein
MHGTHQRAQTGPVIRSVGRLILDVLLSFAQF